MAPLGIRAGSCPVRSFPGGRHLAGSSGDEPDRQDGSGGEQARRDRRQHDHPAAFLEDNRAIFGDLADDTRFTRIYTAILASLRERGVRATLAGLDRYAAA